jgi:hypothetical protein
MMKYRKKIRLMAGAALLAVMTACDNPASPSEHLQAYGVVLRANNAEVVRAQGQTTTGGISILAGQQLGPVTVRFVNRDGNEMEPRQGYWMRVTSEAPAIMRFEYTEGEYSGRLVAGTPGMTQLEFCNMHGSVGRGHADGCQRVTAISVAQ